MNLKERTCCFFGHRKIEVTDELVCRLNDTLEGLIVENKIDTFLFGSKSEFDKLCLKVVTKLKKKYPHIKRIYVRAEFPYINDDYTAYLLKYYDENYMPAARKNSKKNLSEYQPKSGTKLAYDYAVGKGDVVINMVPNSQIF